MKVTLHTIILLFFAAALTAQNYQTISGRIVDQKTGKAVPYANIGIPEKGIGTTSNDNGSFTFKIPNFYANSTVIVSVIGYKTFKRPVSQVNSPVVIELEPTSYELTQIEIMDQGGVENIIRKAVARIPKNYPSKPTEVLGFYRESRTDSSDSFVYMAEGVLNIYKNGYKSSKEGQVSLVQGRKINLENPLDTVLYGGFSSGHMAAHRFDFVKNREDFIDEDFFPAYKYWIETVTTYNGRLVYVIGFDKDEEQKTIKSRKRKSKNFLERLFTNGTTKLDARMRGKLYIEKESFAFIRAEFEITEKGLNKTEDYPLYAGRWTSNTYVVNYKQVGQKWYFSDALREGGRRSGGLYSNEIKITEIDTQAAQQLPYLDRLSRGEEFIDMTGSYDEDFWTSYNTVPMNAKLSESVQQFKNAETAKEVFNPAAMRAVQELRDSVALAERIAMAEKEARENAAENESAEESELFFDPEKITFGEPGMTKERKRKITFQTTFGVGTQLISTPETSLGISYLHEDSGEPLISINDVIKARDFEIIWSTGMNILLNDRWFLRFDGARDFGRTIYRESASGLGVQFNLSRQRPVFLKFSAQHSRIRYARIAGIADNDSGQFRIGSKNFDSDRIRVFYGSRTNNLKLTGEFSVELSKNREVYVRGAYYMPYSSRQEAFFRETSIFLRKKERLLVSNDQVLVTSNDMPFNASLFSGGSLQLTIGYVFK